MKSPVNLKVLLVSSEVSPFAKTGGLADVAGSLPRALVDLGHDVRIVMPKYRNITHQMKTKTDLPVFINDRKETAVIRESHILSPHGKRVPVYFVDNYQYFDRNNLYCYFDEAERFAFFCHAVLEMLPGLEFIPDVIHCNDWQSGPIPVMIKELYKLKSFYKNIASVFTIHNLHYQGNYPKDCLKLLGLGEEYFTYERLEFYGNISFLKAGLVYADVINTVSPKYAQEIQTTEYGERMEGLLQKRSGDLFGIINGIDYSIYNPETDSCIACNYGSRNIELKVENKYALQRAMKLPVRDVPLVGLVSRLVDQKGLDLLEEIFGELMKNDIQMVVLGSGDRYYEDFFRDMARCFPNKFSVYLGFNDALAHQIYAGCDLFLMPSRFEPCGLGQLISLRYGTIPVVRATGGLADTVTNFDPITRQGNGFTFEEYMPGLFLQSIQHALFIFKERRDLWNKLVKRAMSQDYSWSSSAREYIKIYQTAIRKKMTAEI